MDIRCTKCGEPWDIDSLHDYIDDVFGDEVAKRRASEFKKDWYSEEFFSPALAKFRREGCTMFGTTHNTSVDGEAAMMTAALFDMLGDDVDGVASMLDDAGY